MSNLRDVRVRLQVDAYKGGRWHYKEQRLVLLGDVGKWSMVRNADFPQACPFVISRKEWDKMTARGIEAGTATTAGRGPQDESPVAASDAPKAHP